MNSNYELSLGRVMKYLTMYGIDPMEVEVSQYQLILEAGLCNIVGDRLAFYPGRGPSQFITETRLHQQDSFFCDEWGLFLLNTDGPEDVKFEEHTFVDQDYFEKKDVGELGIFYNADLRLIINNVIVLPEVRTDIFKDYKGIVNRRGERGTGLREVPSKFFMLTGTKNLSFWLDLPRTSNWNNSTIRMRLRLGGFLLRNIKVIK
jgi:hypothetical protein